MATHDALQATSINNNTRIQGKTSETSQAPTRRVQQRCSTTHLQCASDNVINSFHQQNFPHTNEGTSTHNAPESSAINNSDNLHKSTKRRRKATDPPTRYVRQRCSTSNLQSQLDANEDTSPVYDDLGDCNERCRYCNAAFWREERLKGHNSYNGQPEYHLCCGGGKVFMDPEVDPPAYIKQLLGNSSFIQNIRAYNQMFSMTSFGAKIDNTINQGRGPYVFKVSGQIYHWIGSLCPTGDDTPCFLQLYIYDTHNEVQNRMTYFEDSNRGELDLEVVEGLIHFVDSHNELVQLFRTARDKCAEADVPEFKVRLYNAGGARSYELPTANTLGAIVFDNGSTTETDYDVIIEARGGPPKRVNKLHQSYMSLQFPLIFIYGQPGFHPKLKIRSADPNDKARRVSMNAFYTYQLHPRHDQYNILFQTDRLFQQYVVGVYCCIEQNRMDFYRTHQNDIRGEYLSGLYDAISRGDRDGSEVGSRLILPSSFTRGPRYMYSHYLDALAIFRVLGNPQFFITFTCNVNWPKIQRYMAAFPHLNASDRADIICRVFEQKIKALIRFLKQQQTFGCIIGVLYTVEFQKRGLPHCHTLVWVSSSTKIQNAEDVDQYISAELPDPAVDPRGYKIVSEMMMHGPCGKANPAAPCMQGEVCTKKFSKKYNNHTFFDDEVRVHYRRRQTKISTPKHKMNLDNTYVVPYNRSLCLAFSAHINVEYCGWSMLIKYLFKYISKGTDRIFAQVTRYVGDAASAAVQPHPYIDEIQNFVDGRFICPHEACWRILKFEIHSREPAVQILSVHLEGMQHITFRDHESLESVVNRPDKKLTTLTEWFTYNIENTDGRHLTYLEFPSQFVWYQDRKSWSRRKNTKYYVGRLAYVHPSLGEVFYFRILLCHQRGCRSFADVRTVNRVVYPTYRAACEALGLLGDDKEWDTALQEACMSASSPELRFLFSQVLTHCEVTNPLQLWNKYWEEMGHDIPRIVSEYTRIPNYHVNDVELQGYILYELQILLTSSGKSVEDYGLQPPSRHLLDQLNNQLLMEEKNYNRASLAQEKVDSVPKLNAEQRRIYELILNDYTTGRQELIFVYGHGGTGKTFFWKTIISTLRSEGKIVLAVAYSGIAFLLLPSGRTAHSRFKLPLELTDEMLCRVKKKLI